MLPDQAADLEEQAGKDCLSGEGSASQTQPRRHLPNGYPGSQTCSWKSWLRYEQQKLRSEKAHVS